MKKYNPKGTPTIIRVDREVWKYITASMEPGDSKNRALRRLLGLDNLKETQHESRETGVAESN